MTVIAQGIAKKKDWLVRATPDDSVLINRNRGESANIRLRVKYVVEEDWIDHLIWLVPGWQPADIWREAYAWIADQNRYYFAITGENAEVEDARLDKFNLV